MNRLLGIPLKISTDNAIYIPKTFWLHYGISVNDEVIREERQDRVIFRCHQTRQLLLNEKILRVYQGTVHLRPGWLSQNNLAAGDKVWLIGTEDGIVVYTHPANVQI